MTSQNIWKILDKSTKCFTNIITTHPLQVNLKQRRVDLLQLKKLQKIGFYLSGLLMLNILVYLIVLFTFYQNFKSLNLESLKLLIVNLARAAIICGLLPEIYIMTIRPSIFKNLINSVHNIDLIFQGNLFCYYLKVFLNF